MSELNPNLVPGVQFLLGGRLLLCEETEDGKLTNEQIQLLKEHYGVEVSEGTDSEPEEENDDFSLELEFGDNPCENINAANDSFDDEFSLLDGSLDKTLKSTPIQDESLSQESIDDFAGISDIHFIHDNSSRLDGNDDDDVIFLGCVQASSEISQKEEANFYQSEKQKNNNKK